MNRSIAVCAAAAAVGLVGTPSADDPPNTLRNQADLPAAPFRTDDWPAPASDSKP